MLRGAVLVRRLQAIRIIDKDAPLLVVGAGAGGVTAALTAVELNVVTYLIDNRRAPFQAQALASTRHIDPTQYDWPLDQWMKKTFPWLSPVGYPSIATPLPFLADSADMLAGNWVRVLNDRYRRSRGLFELDYGKELLHLRPLGTAPGSEHIEATFDDGTRGRFGAVIWAAGFGREKRFSPSPTNRSYEGPPFWGPDELAGCLHNHYPTSPSVLISGGSDGALQDYM